MTLLHLPPPWTTLGREPCVVTAPCAWPCPLLHSLLASSAWPLGPGRAYSCLVLQSNACWSPSSTEAQGISLQDSPGSPRRGSGQISIASFSRGPFSPVEPAYRGRRGGGPLQQCCYQRGNLNKEQQCPTSTPRFPGDTVSVAVRCHTNPLPVRQRVPQGQGARWNILSAVYTCKKKNRSEKPSLVFLKRGKVGGVGG